MNHAKAILIKGIMTFAVLLLLMGSFAGIGDILIITLVLGAISYLAGDLFISTIVASKDDIPQCSSHLWIGKGIAYPLPRETVVILHGPP